MKSRPGLKLGHVGSETRSQGHIFLKNLFYTQEGTVLIQFSRNFVRMCMVMKSVPSLKLDHVGPKPRYLG